MRIRIQRETAGLLKSFLAIVIMIPAFALLTANGAPVAILDELAALLATRPKPLFIDLLPRPRFSPVKRTALKIDNALPVIRATPIALEATPPATPVETKPALSLIRAFGLKVTRIVIDAGHGGFDEGAVGPHGVKEKDVVLDVAVRTARLVQSLTSIEVVLTRAADTFVPLRDRTLLANSRNGDLFLSIHANSSSSSSMGGIETYILNFTRSRAELELSYRENAGSTQSIGDLKSLIRSIALNEKLAESASLAQMIETSMANQVAKANPGGRNRGVKRAPFLVLTGAAMPSVLAEIGFLSNSRDESNLAKPEYRQKIAEALYEGIWQYTKSLGRLEMARM